MLAVDQDIEVDEVTTTVYDGYKFHLGKSSTQFVKFQVRIIVKIGTLDSQVILSNVFLDVFQLLDTLPKSKFY